MVTMNSFLTFFFLVPHSYVLYGNKDCETNKNLDSIHETNYESCENACNTRSECGGFVLKGSSCWLKSVRCGQDLWDRPDTNTYIKQGNVFIYLHWHKKL